MLFHEKCSVSPEVEEVHELEQKVGDENLAIDKAIKSTSNVRLDFLSWPKSVNYLKLAHVEARVDPIRLCHDFGTLAQIFFFHFFLWQRNVFLLELFGMSKTSPSK